MYSSVLSYISTYINDTDTQWSLPYMFDVMHFSDIFFLDPVNGGEVCRMFILSLVGSSGLQFNYNHIVKLVVDGALPK